MNYFWALLIPLRSGKQRTIELSLVFVVQVILISALLHAYLPMVTRTEVLKGAMFGLERYKREISYHWALYGEWPQNDSGIENFHSDSFEPDDYGRIDHTAIEKGAIQIFFKGNLAGDVLSCRPAIAPADSSGPVIWGCGEINRAPKQWRIQGTSRTSIDPYYIPMDLR